MNLNIKYKSLLEKESHVTLVRSVDEAKKIDSKLGQDLERKLLKQRAGYFVGDGKKAIVYVAQGHPHEHRVIRHELKHYLDAKHGLWRSKAKNRVAHFLSELGAKNVEVKKPAQTVRFFRRNLKTTLPILFKKASESNKF